MILPCCKTAAEFFSARPGRSEFFSTKPTQSGIAPTALAVSSMRGEIAVNKIIAQQQIARRIAAQKKFRREDEFRAERDGFFITRQKFLPVRCEIADGRIELEQADFQ